MLNLTVEEDPALPCLAALQTPGPVHTDSGSLRAASCPVLLPTQQPWSDFCTLFFCQGSAACSDFPVCV